MSSASPEQLRFRSDFAACVLAEADRIARRRRRIVHASAFAAVAVGAVVFAAGIWSMVAPREPARGMNPPVTANTKVNLTALADIRQTEPVDYMFPDAAPLAQFADRYSNAATGGAAARRNMLFAAETGEDGTR